MARNRNIKGSINRKYKRDSKVKSHDKIQRKKWHFNFFFLLTLTVYKNYKNFFKIHIFIFYFRHFFFPYILNFDICFERTYISFRLWLICYLVFGVSHVSLGNERDAQLQRLNNF